MAEDRFVELYVQVERLNRRYATSPDSLRAHRAELFKAYGTKPEDVERAVAWYRQHPEQGVRALEKIAERLEAEEPPHPPPPSPTEGREGEGRRQKKTEPQRTQRTQR